MEIAGKIYRIDEVQSITDRFRKREFILSRERDGYNGTYVEYIKLQLEQRDVFLINDFEIGDNVVVKFEVKGRLYEKNGEEIVVNSLKALDIYSPAQRPEENPFYNPLTDPNDDLAHI